MREVTPAQLADEPVDVVVLQRPRDLELAAALARRPPASRPSTSSTTARAASVPRTRHPLADRADMPLVHVTHFNALMWDSGRAPTTVIEHGVVDPGPLWTGELARLGVVVNEPARRGRLVGTDLMPGLRRGSPRSTCSA